MTKQTSSYSVFLSYNSEDAEFVEKIAVYLADSAKLRPWLDRWEMIPGESSVKQLERGLSTSDACAVFVGESGQGPWQNEEVEAALQKAIKKEGFRVIPVLLPGLKEQPELPSFLANKTWVNLRNGLSDDNALYLLECGIQGKAPGRGRPEQVEEAPEPARACDGHTPGAQDKAGHVRQNVSLNEPKSQIDPSKLIIPGGALEFNSRFYIRRNADEEIFFALQRLRALVISIHP